MSIAGECAVIVAHPDDETLWMGGTMLMYPHCRWTVVTICRKSDPDRAPRFFEALNQYNAEGGMGDLDDGPEQVPLPNREVQDCITGLLPSNNYDVIFTHGSGGEYTRHLRHEETGKAVMGLCRDGVLHYSQLLRFAYGDDGGGKYLPEPIEKADVVTELPERIWTRKHEIITKIYGFAPDSFEAMTTPKKESFWRYGRHLDELSVSCGSNENRI